MNLKGTKKKNQVSNVNIFEQQELLKKIEVVRENLTASTWRELETSPLFHLAIMRMDLAKQRNGQ